MLHFIDFEVFKYDWLCVIVNPFNGEETVIVNDSEMLGRYYEKHINEIFVGYNIRQYDQFIMKAILMGLDPKRVNDKIIKENKANIMTDVEDLRYIMRWNEDKKVVAKQMRMFRDFSEEEQMVMDVFGNDNIIYLDKIITETKLSPTKIASILLSLEFDGVLTALPGKRYQKLYET